MSLRATPPDAVELSIGSLSAVTGVPIDTLRTWERRYGFPTPIERTEGSHRRYPAETVDVVHLIVTALSQGHRASTVVGKSADEIRRLISLGKRRTPVDPSGTDLHRVLERWMALTLELDGVGLATELELCLANMAVIPFLERCLGPYLAEVGERWARGELRVAHEHFASERTREFLSAHWRRLAEGTSPDAPKVVLATPPGEHHVLGLHMAAWVVSLAGARAVFLGANTPMVEIAFAVEQHDARGVVLSVAEGYAGELGAHLGTLLPSLLPHVKVAVGGAGMSYTAVQVDHKVNRFDDLARWSQGLRQH